MYSRVWLYSEHACSRRVIKFRLLIALIAIQTEQVNQRSYVKIRGMLAWFNSSLFFMTRPCETISVIIILVEERINILIERNNRETVPSFFFFFFLIHCLSDENETLRGHRRS